MTNKKIKCDSCEADYILKYEEELYPIQCPFCGFEYVDNDEDEIEGPMINYEIDLFDFERALDTMLIFSWRTGDYESSKQTYFQDDLGFRCAYWAE